MKDVKDFDKPLNTPIVEKEEIEVTTPVVNPVTKQVTFEKTKQEVETETTYHHVRADKVSCEKGKHEWFMKDPHKYVVSCPNCMRNRSISPLTQTIKDGHIVLRKSGKIID